MDPKPNNNNRRPRRAPIRNPGRAEPPGIDVEPGPGASQREINAHLLLSAWKLVKQEKREREREGVTEP
jgi:hypothetical protein